MSHDGTPSPATLSRLGEQVVREQDEAASLALDTERGLRRLQRATDRAPTRSRRWMLAVALVAATAAVALWGWLRTTPLTFEITQRSMAAGEWLDPSEPTTLSFSEGTRIVVEADSRARVASIDEHGATLELDAGTLRAEIEPLTDARWRMNAGPYTVHVTGTAFILRWDPDTQRLHIEMLEGSVRITGPDLGEGQALTAPSRLDLGIQRETEASTATAPAPTASAGQTAALIETIPAPSAAPSKISWRGLDEKGLRSEAMEEVHREGTNQLAAREDAAGLLRLAQLARLEGDATTSQRFLLALRKRYPETLQAQTATYLAGKSLHDAGKHGAAIADLQAYLAMAPDGAFAREAKVLLILSLHALGDPRADALARAYLAKRGDDVHAARVRQALAPRPSPSHTAPHPPTSTP